MFWENAYFLHNGAITTEDEIKQAFATGKARLICSHAGHPVVSLNGEDFDLRGETYPNGTPLNMSEQSWTRAPESVAELLRAARCRI